MDLTPNPAYLEAVRRSASPSTFRGYLGIDLDVLEVDRAVVVMDISERHLQSRGVVAGGVMATLIDTATYWAAFARLPEDCGLANVDLKLNLLEAVGESTGRLIAEGVCVRPGRKLSYCTASVRDDFGRLLAHGTSSIVSLPGKGLDLDLPKFLATEAAR